MKTGILFAMVAAMSVVSMPAMAWDHLTFSESNQPQATGGDQDHGGDQKQDQRQDCKKQKNGQEECRATNRVEKFNVVCYYRNRENPESFRTCKAAAHFAKFVTSEGGEVTDESPRGVEPGNPFLPVFDVECDRLPRYTDSAFRVTDLLSTRIVGTTGPHPSIYLPRGSLTVGDHVADSYLELEDGNQFYKLGGRCYVWSD